MMNYWINREERKEKARLWDKKMRLEYPEYIRESINETALYNGIPEAKARASAGTEFILAKADTVSALMKCSKENGRTAVHNFASYKNPGGFFLGGSSAQEESLCHESALYEVLSDKRFADDYYGWNKTHLNYALYLDRALYSPDVLFIRGSIKRSADVITCAAPNWKTCEKYHPEKKKENEQILDKRIEMLQMICEDRNADTLITGAWGCGVFGQDPDMVCRSFIEHFSDSGLRYVIFAVPDQQTYVKFKENMPK